MKEGIPMHVATHLIKIKGNFDKNIWTEDKLDKYVRSKISGDITNFYRADLELFGIEDEVVNVWVFVSALPSEVSKDIIDKWLKNHINEEGITVTGFEIEELFDLVHPKERFVALI
jgi:thymidylate synthase